MQEIFLLDVFSISQYWSGSLTVLQDETYLYFDYSMSISAPQVAMILYVVYWMSDVA